jgi:bacterioferritin
VIRQFFKLILAGIKSCQAFHSYLTNQTDRKPSLTEIYHKEDSMKGDDRVIAKLNDLLAEELTASNQYMLHSEMCENWGYKRLYEVTRKRAIDEMKHAEKLMERILFLEGMPNVSKLNPIRIGSKVEDQLKNDLGLEHTAQKSYNDGIKLAVEAGDNGTRELLTSILQEEEDHIDFFEAQFDQISQMGLPQYLEVQVKT